MRKSFLRERIIHLIKQLLKVYSALLLPTLLLGYALEDRNAAATSLNALRFYTESEYIPEVTTGSRTRCPR